MQLKFATAHAISAGKGTVHANLDVMASPALFCCMLLKCIISQASKTIKLHWSLRHVRCCWIAVARVYR